MSGTDPSPRCCKNSGKPPLAGLSGWVVCVLKLGGGASLWATSCDHMQNICWRKRPVRGSSVSSPANLHGLARCCREAKAAH